MRNKRDSLKSIVLLAVIVSIITFMVAYLYFLQQHGENINNPMINSSLPKWADYILKQNITSITYDGYNENSKNDNDMCIQRNLSIDQLKDILKKMTASKLRKYDLGGVGGPCSYGITIKYDDKKLDITAGSWISVKDNDPMVISLLSKEKYIFTPSVNDDPWWVYGYDWDARYINQLLFSE